MRSRLINHRLSATGLAFVFLFATWIAPVHAQLNAQLAGCEGLNEGVSLALAKSCSAHVGCNMVLKLKKDCSKALDFLARLRGSLLGRTEITNNDVFEANSPELKPSPVLKALVASVQKIVNDAATDPFRAKHEFKPTPTEVFYYEGGLSDGKMHGVGVGISSGGAMQRGQWESGLRSGQAQVVSSDGSLVIVGNWLNGKKFGMVAEQHFNGQVSVGTAAGEILHVGVWEIRDSAGNTTKVLYGPDGREVARGPKAPPGQVAEDPPGASSSTPGSPDYQPPQRAASGATGVAGNVPGSPGYLPPRRPATAPQADDPKVPGAFYRP